MIALHWIWNNRTKSLGYLQVVLGVLAGATGVFPDPWPQRLLLASGLTTALIGHYNSTRKP